MNLEAIDTLDDHDIVVVRDATRRPKPGQVRYSLRRAADELDAIGLTLVIRPRRHGRPAHSRKQHTR